MESINEILTKHLENIKKQIAQQMSSNNRNATGRSVSSMTVEVSGNHGILWGSKSFVAMEKGRGPGKVPYGFFDIIYDWAKAKRITPKTTNKNQAPDGALRSFAGAVAYTIMNKGTVLFRQGKFNDIYTTAINKELEVLSNEILLVSANIIDNINKNL